MLNPIFLIGSPKSGKTLLSATLNKHPEIFILPELNTFSNVLRLWNKRHCKDKKSAASCPAEMLFNSWMEINKQHSISKEDISECIVPTYQSFGVLLNQYMLLLMSKAKSTAKIWGDDTPHNTGCIEKILKEYPAARFIYSRRDPRNIVSDLTSIDYRHASNNELQNAFIMRRYIEQYEKQRQLIPQDQLLEIRHEDFLGNPRETTKDMCRFLHIDYFSYLNEPADQDTVQAIGWPGSRFWEAIEPQYQIQVSCEAEAYLADLIIGLGYKIDGLCRLNYSRRIAQLKLLPYLSLFMVYNTFWQIKYPTYPFLVSKLPYLQYGLPPIK